MEALINNTQTYREQQEISSSWCKNCLLMYCRGEIGCNLTTITDPNVQTIIFIILIAFPFLQFGGLSQQASAWLPNHHYPSVSAWLMTLKGSSNSIKWICIINNNPAKSFQSVCPKVKFKKFWISCFSFLQLVMLIDVADINYFSCTIMSVKGLLISGDICG